MNEFSNLGLASELSAAFDALGFKSPTKVQRLAIPRILQKKDIFMQSETGTGKTFAYLAPAISSVIGASPSKGPLILVLCPTRNSPCKSRSKPRRSFEASHIAMNVLSLLGGSPLSRQEDALKKKPHIVVGTPGRTGDLAKMRLLKLDNAAFIVLDEGDRLFSTEYRDHVQNILGAASPNSCKILASATISPNTRKLARAFMHDSDPSIFSTKASSLAT